MKGYFVARHGRKFDYDSWWSDFTSDVKDFGGKALEFSINHSPSRLLAGRDFDYSDYGSMLAWSQVPIVNDYARNRAEQLRYEEQQRYNKDRAAALGIDLEDNPYPITAGLYAGIGSGNTAANVGNSIIDMYHELDKLKRWK